jgi:pyrimidine-specific ribonucleoside hydrolase
MPLVVDTDMAPDDVIAIASLLRDPTVDIRAITVVGTGEAHCQGGMFVARAIVTILRDAPIPVTCGRKSPLAAAEEFPSEWRAAADTGNGLALISPSFSPDARPAAELLAELASAEAAAGGRLTILTLGTMTNIATALEVDPGLPAKVRLVSMLGAVRVPGNVTTQAGDPTAEWNAHADPTAVQRVLVAGFDWTLVPLDATASVPVTPELYEALASDHAAAPADIVFELWARNPYMTQSGFYLWDPLAAAAVRDPTIVTLARVRLSVVEGAGLDGGRLLEDPAGAAVTVALAADRERFEPFLLERLRLGGARDGAFAPVGTVRVVTDGTTCEVTLDPATPPPGLLRVEVTSTAGAPVAVVAFNLDDVPWSDVEAFVASPDFASPPPVHSFANPYVDGSGAATAWGDATSGPIGIACVLGIDGSGLPTAVVLRGPFAIDD